MSKLKFSSYLLAIALVVCLPRSVWADCQLDCDAAYSENILRCTTTVENPDGAEQSEADATCEEGIRSQQEACSRRCGESPTPNGAGAATTVTLLNPLGLSDPRLIVGRIIKGILSIIGTVTLAMFMYGGILWITSMGESKKVEKGKSIFVWTTLGLGIIAIAYTAVNAIMNALRTGSVT